MCVIYGYVMVIWRIAFRSGSSYMPEPQMGWSLAAPVDWTTDVLLLMHMVRWWLIVTMEKHVLSTTPARVSVAAATHMATGDVMACN